MRIISIFLFSIVSIFANADVADLKMQSAGKYVPVKIQEYNGLKLTRDCFKSKIPKCDAFVATTKKTLISKSKIPLAGHPAARLCLDRDGLNRIVKDKDNKQYDYCLFKDGSMIDAWNLYYLTYSKTTIEK